MKRLYLHISIAALMLAAACQSPTSDHKASNQVTYDGTTYSVSQSSIYPIGDWDETDTFYVELMGPQVTLDTSTGTWGGGTGLCVGLALYRSGLASRTGTFSFAADEITDWYGRVYVNDEETALQFTITGGSVTVKDNGAKISVTGTLNATFADSGQTGTIAISYSGPTYQIAADTTDSVSPRNLGAVRSIHR